MVDNKFKPALATIPGFPQRCSVYTIAMMKAGVRIPERDPPPFPDELRKVLKRSGHDFSKTPKAATWVCSHLCHNKRCINTAHLRWEPSWFNRLRDNCPGGDECVHRPDRCMQAHRAAGGELLDWTKYWGWALGLLGLWVGGLLDYEWNGLILQPEHFLIWWHDDVFSPNPSKFLYISDGLIVFDPLTFVHWLMKTSLANAFAVVSLQ
jgi:hypothetical protein